MSGTWQGLVHQPTFNCSTMILLTDGRVMVQEEATPHWHALTPDANGSYINGNWSALADMSFWRRYYASGVLKDGRVIICGGEQSGDVGDTNKGEIYDPVSDSWSPIPKPGTWAQVGDAASCILPDGRLMIGALQTPDCTIYDPSTNTWTAAASKAIRSNEETWVLLPDDTIVTTQCWAPWQSEKYIISSNIWKNEGTPPVSLINQAMDETGPALLLYNGKVIFFGADNVGGYGKTAIYTPPAAPTGTGTWVAGPDIPNVGGQVMVCNDCPGTLLPNGKVLFTGAVFMNNYWGTPVHFFEYDPPSNTITPAPTPPNNGNIVYMSRMMLLPTGEVMFSPSSTDVQVYTPGGAPAEAWRPTISAVGPQGFVYTEYFLQGTQLNGLSQANMYGDDCYSATNYPLVRLRDPVSGQVYFARTFEFSTMGVATGSSLQACRFSVPGLPIGDYELTVIANGIASHVFSFRHRFRKTESLEVRHKREFELIGKEIYEGDPWRRWEWLVDPAIFELRSQLKSLQNSVRRIESLITKKQLPGVGTKTAHEADEVEKKGKASKKT